MTATSQMMSGHLPGHVRETFRAAIDAFMEWNDGEPEPTVEFEVRYHASQIPITRACVLVWNCTDCLPRLDFDQLKDEAGLPIGRQTYAASARAMHAAIKNCLAKN